MAKSRFGKPIVILIFFFTLIGGAAIILPSGLLSVLSYYPELSFHVVLVAPDRCEDVHGYLSNTSEDSRERVLGKLIPLAGSSSEELKSLSDKQTGVIDSLVRLYSRSSQSDEQKITKCLRSLLSRVVTQTEPLLNTLLKRYGSIKKLRYAANGSWYGVIADACRNHNDCAKKIAKRYSSEQNTVEQEEWLVFLGQLNEFGAGEVLPIYENLPGLGLSRHDTDPATHEQAEQLVKVITQKFSAKSEDLGRYLSDKSRSLAARWRIARSVAAIQNQFKIPKDLILEAFASEQMGADDRFDLLIDEPNLAEELPEAIAEYAKVGAKIVNDLTEVDQNHEQRIADFTEILRHWKTLKLAPLPKDVTETTRRNITETVSELIIYLGQRGAPTSEAFRTLTEAAQGHPLIQEPLPAVSVLLQNETTIDHGLALLTPGKKLRTWGYISIADAALHAKANHRQSLVDRLTAHPFDSDLNLSLATAIFPFLMADEEKAFQQRIHKIPEKFVASLAQLSEDPQLNLAQQIAYQAALSKFNMKGKKAANYVYELSRKFNCTTDWVNTAHAITYLGPKTPGFEAAVFKLLSCPPEMVDYAHLNRALLDKLARRRVQDFLNAGTNRTQTSPKQIERLTEVLSHANRVPGSTLPPKVKRNSN